MKLELLINKLDKADEILSEMRSYCVEALTESERKYRLLNESARIKFLFTEVELLLKTDTGATHGKLPFRKHDVSGSEQTKKQLKPCKDKRRGKNDECKYPVVPFETKMQIRNTDSE